MSRVTQSFKNNSDFSNLNLNFESEFLNFSPKKDVLFIIGDWNAKAGSRVTHGVTGKFGLGVQNEARQRLTEFCQENTLLIVNILFQQHKKQLYT